MIVSDTTQKATEIVETRHFGDVKSARPSAGFHVELGEEAVTESLAGVNRKTAACNGDRVLVSEDEQ